MYKVFFNDSFFILTNNPLLENSNKLPIIPLQDIKQLENWISEIENTIEPVQCIFTNDNPSDIWHQLNKNLKIVVAAGGLVKNSDGKFLFIFRRGKWDLPKGKIDKGERIDETAIREVQEETGVEDVYIDSEVFVTYHIYRYKGKLALKPTYWYTMCSIGSDALTPQTDEDIEKAVWLNTEEINEIKKNAFGTILDVVDFFGICEK